MSGRIWQVWGLHHHSFLTLSVRSILKRNTSFLEALMAGATGVVQGFVSDGNLFYIVAVSSDDQGVHGLEKRLAASLEFFRFAPDRCLGFARRVVGVGEKILPGAILDCGQRIGQHGKLFRVITLIAQLQSHRLKALENFLEGCPAMIDWLPGAGVFRLSTGREQ